MRLSVIFLISTLPLSFSFGQGKSKGYTYTVDLTNVKDDKVFVELVPPALSKNEATFYFPKIIPGTYAIVDYGRYVSDFTAVDKKGNKLPVIKADSNTWKISNAKQVARISYWVDDTFDTNKEGPEIFWPAGTNIEEGKNFVLNAAGFFGYFDGQQKKPFQINVVRDPEFYGTTGLIPAETGSSPSPSQLQSSTPGNKLVDVFRTADYDELIDSPIMYSKPDTAMIRVANTQVLIGSYSPTNKVTAREIAESIREVLMAQKEYLGGKLPVVKYAFIFYFTDQPVMSYGALEHSYSSMYYMPEMAIGEMNQQLRDFAAHEFFHIVTPLTVHSEEIHFFDFNNPKMSQHLWMYEGVTEYFAGNVQVKYGLIALEQYIGMLYEKMVTADQFRDDVPFTEMSKQTLDKYHDQYYNVYQKGALIGLCLDLKLRELSDGKYGLQNLMLDLSKRYGKNRPFKDDALFTEITKMTYPEIGVFFTRHVKGSEKLPLKEAFGAVGIDYTEELQVEDYSLGIGNDNIGVTQVDNKARLEITSTDNMNTMGQTLGFQVGDVLLGINGEPMPDMGPDLSSFIQNQYATLPERDTLRYTVLRRGENGEAKQIELSAPVSTVEINIRHAIQPQPGATQKQLALRDSWLKP